jgi:hypothetical protein
MSLRLVSSARNLRDQFKGGNNSQQQTGNSTTSSGSSIFTNASNVSNIKTLDPSGVPSGGSILSRQGTLLRAQSNGNLRRAKSIQKKSNMGRGDSSMPDLSMEVTRVIVKRCIKEIRERGRYPPPCSFLPSFAFLFPFSYVLSLAFLLFLPFVLFRCFFVFVCCHASFFYSFCLFISSLRVPFCVALVTRSVASFTHEGYFYFLQFISLIRSLLAMHEQKQQ